MSNRQARARGRRIGGVRLRLPELLREHRITAYKLAKLSGLPVTSVYRFVKNKGRVSFVSGHYVESLARALGEPIERIIQLEHVIGRPVKRGRRAP